jgi:hypothetical protein
METSQLRRTPSPCGIASRLPCSMCQRTVRGDISRDLAATWVVTHPECAVSSRPVAASSPRVWSSPTRGGLDPLGPGPKALSGQPRASQGPLGPGPLLQGRL